MKDASEANGIVSLRLMTVLSPGPVGLGVDVLLGDTRVEWTTDLERGLGMAVEGSVAVVDAIALFFLNITAESTFPAELSEAGLFAKGSRQCF